MAVDSEFINSNGEIPSAMRRKKLKNIVKKKKSSIDDYKNSISGGKITQDSRYLTTAGTIQSKGNEKLSTK